MFYKKEGFGSSFFLFVYRENRSEQDGDGRDIYIFLYEEVTYMSTIKNIFVGAVTYATLSAAAVIGLGVGGVLWENGLEKKVREKTQKLFSK